MLLGGPVYEDTDDPQIWIQQLKSLGYQAAYCPLKPGASSTLIQAFSKAAEGAGIVIAEVGAWSNPLSPDPVIAEKARTICLNSLELADKVGARCCVNISGSRGQVWDGPDPANFSNDTFDLVVQTVRSFIDTINPLRTVYCLETMPWMIPDSLDTYELLIKAIDRKSFAVHFDPVNLITSPRMLYCSGDLIRSAFARFGDKIVSCHVKDAVQVPGFPVNIQEVAPGRGSLDHGALLRCVYKSGIPLMLEHLNNQQDYQEAATYLKTKAIQEGLSWGVMQDE